jgi:hypothetical protein
MPADRLARSECEVPHGHEGAKLGWFRVNFNYFIDVAVVDYVVDAAHLIANEGVKLLAPYRFDAFAGLWHHRDARSRPPVSLYDIASGAIEFRANARRHPSGCWPSSCSRLRTSARRCRSSSAARPSCRIPSCRPHLSVSAGSRSLREAQRELAALGRNSQ